MLKIGRSISVLALVALGGCASSEIDGTQKGPVVTTTTEGEVTTVVNESGSVWSEPASLVEELSIGVDEGPQAYMFGRVLHLWDAGERIVVIDRSVPVVRVYGADGQYVGDVGRAGQGPGEYQVPFSVAVLPDGRILVTDTANEWLQVFSSDFVYQERWPANPVEFEAPGARLMYTLTLLNDGSTYLSYQEIESLAPIQVRLGWRPVSRDRVGSPVWPPQGEHEGLRNCTAADCSRSLAIPFDQAPFYVLAPDGSVVGGRGLEYQFQIINPEGQVTEVEHYGTPTPLSEEEWNYWTRRGRAQGVAGSPAWRPSWSADVPRSKPAFFRIYPAQEGKFLVVREGNSRRVENCTEDPLAQPSAPFVPCWEPTYLWDVFDADGAYVGEITPPAQRAHSRPFVDGDRITLAVEDDAGVVRIKRYRIDAPDRG